MQFPRIPKRGNLSAHTLLQQPAVAPATLKTKTYYRDKGYAGEVLQTVTQEPK